MNNQLAGLGSQQNQVRAEVVNPGQISRQPGVPSAPSSPNRLVTLAGGFALGLLAGAAVALLRQRTDDVIRRPEDLIRRTRVPVAAVLSSTLHNGSVDILPPMSSDGRGYARLRNLVTTGLLQTNRPVVVVAGVRHGGGPVAANLAASLGRAGEEVYLLCADVFGTTATALLGGQPQAGLAEVLAGEIDVAAATHAVPGIPHLRVIGPGRDPDRADALLQTRSPRTLIDHLVRSASYVVIEAPATSDSPDAQTLANMADLAVLVVEVGKTAAREVLDACAQFESMGTPVLGAVAAHYGRDRKASPRPAAPPTDTSPVTAEQPPAADADLAWTASSSPSASLTGPPATPGFCLRARRPGDARRPGPRGATTARRRPRSHPPQPDRRRDTGSRSRSGRPPP